MYKSIVTFLIFSFVSIVISEKESYSAKEEEKPKIDARNETTTFTYNITLDIVTTTSVNIDVFTTTEQDEQTEKNNEPQLRFAITDDHTTESYKTSNDSFRSIDTATISEKDLTKRDGNVTHIKQENMNDEIEDYDETKMSNISHFSLNKNTDYRRNVDQRLDGHQNLHLNIKSRSGNENNDDDNKGHQNDTAGELFEESKNLKNVFDADVLVSVNNSGEFPLSNDTAKLKNEDSTEPLQHLRNAPNEHDSEEYTSNEDIYVKPFNNQLLNIQQSSDVYNKDISEIQDLNERDIVSATIEINERPNILLDLKYRSGEPEKNFDQEAVANITPPILISPFSRMGSSSEMPEEENKTIDDYSDKLSSNAYVYRPIKVNKKVKEPNKVYHREKDNDKIPPAEEEKNKDIVEIKETRRVYMHNNNAVYLTGHMNLSPGNTRKKGSNIDLKQLPQKAVVDSEFNNYSYEQFPFNWVAKLNPNQGYKSNQLRLGVDHLQPPSIKELVSKINNLMTKLSYSNLINRTEQLNSYNQKEKKYKQVSLPLSHDRYSLIEPNNLRILEKPLSIKLQNDEHQINPGHIKGVKLRNQFLGVTPRLRDGRRSGVPSKFNWLIELQRQRKRSKRRQQRRYCLQSRRSILNKRLLLLSRLRRYLNN